MTSKDIISQEKHYLMHTYSRFPIVLDKGKGAYVFDKEGKKYLDFIGGIATCSIGHGNTDVAKEISKQAKKLINTTCLYYTEPQVKLAKKLIKLSGLNNCFFSNSGTEAIEAAIKLARKHTGKYEIIATKSGFHGRTLGALAATWTKKYKVYFKPMVPGFKHVKYNDAEALDKAITKKTAAVIIEPIQGEAGIVMPDKGYLKQVRKICNKHNILMIIDEVQSGVGRTGKFFAYSHEGILPDITATAKGIANGIPLGITICSKKVSSFEPGDHGSTFGGNNLSCAAALATIGFIEKKNLMKNADKMGKYFLDGLNKLDYPFIKEVRGKGLMLAVELDKKVRPIVNKCLKNGLLVGSSHENIIRFLPPLIITKKDIDKAVKILDKVLSEC